MRFLNDLPHTILELVQGSGVGGCGAADAFIDTAYATNKLIGNDVKGRSE